MLTPSEKESVSLKTRPTISLPFQEIATLRMRSFSILMFGVALAYGASFAHAINGAVYTEYGQFADAEVSLQRTLSTSPF